jgi:hypothetical protein
MASKPGLVGHAGQTAFCCAVTVVMAVAFLAFKPRVHWVPGAFRVNPFKAGAGFDFALPRDALDGIALIRAHGLNRVRLGGGIRKRPLIWQRIVEGGYPVRPDDRSAAVVDYRDRIDAASCRIVAVRGRVAYARCKG